MMRSGRNTRSAAGVGDSKAAITRTGTRLTTTTVSKPKPCMVRLEKFGQKKESPDDSKKQITPVTTKTRNVPTKKVPDRQIISTVNKTINKPNVKTTKLPTTPTPPAPMPMTEGRSKRTPKPNPKYQNESLITSFRGKTEKSDDEIEDDEQIISSGDDEEFKIDGEEKASSASGGEASDKDDNDIEKNTIRSGPIKGKIPIANHPSLIQFSSSTTTSGSSSATTINNNLNKSRQNVRNIITAIASGSSNRNNEMASKTTGTIDITKKITPPPAIVQRSRAEITNSLLRKRKLEFEKERELQRKRLNAGLSDSGDISDDVIITSPPPQKQIRLYNNNNRQSTSIGSTAQQNQTKILSNIGGNRNQQQTINKLQPKNQTTTTTLNRQKQINLNGKNLNQNQKTRVSSPAIKIINKKMDTNDDEKADPISGNSENIDDFEAMPTFTIVNINDIIGKKGDVLIEKTTNDNFSKSNELIELSPSQRNTSGSRINNNNNNKNNNNNNNNNRRKAMHTTILSDKADKINKPQATKRPQQQQQTSGKLFTNNNNITALSTTTKGPPRILNTGIVKKSPSLFTKSNTDFESSFEKLMKNQEKAKENLQQQTTKTLSSSAAATLNSGNTPTVPTAIKRKLPSEKVVIQRQGNKIIKKITCFETWYVINIPDPPKNYDNKLSLNKLDISLTSIANSIKTITLPSGDWACKVSLQKLSPSQYSLIIDNNLEKFTGDVGDPTISNDDKYKYQPINVMFRRNSKIKNVRMPYDRAVILKNDTFFTNIEGKNIKLIGSPNIIKNFQDLEILLQIVDDMTLINQFVEPASFNP